MFSDILQPKEYGRMSIYMSYEQLMFIICTFELSIGAYQRGVLKFKNNVKLYTQSCIVLSWIITFVFGAIIIILKTSFNIPEMNNSVLFLLLIYFFTQVSYNCWITRMRYKYKYKPVVLTTLIFTVGGTICGLLAVYLYAPTANIKYIAVLIFEIIFCIPFILKDFFNFDFSLNKIKEMWSQISYTLKMQIPVVFHSLSYIVLSSVDRIMIGAMIGSSEAGIYSIAYSLSMSITLFHSSLNQVYRPKRLMDMESKNYIAIKGSTNKLILVILLLTTIFILVAPDLMRIMFSESYLDAVWLIPPIAIGSYFMFFYSIFTDIEISLDKSKIIGIISVVCALLNIIMNYFALKYWGYMACAYTTLISYLIFAVAHYISTRKICTKQNINFYNIFDQKSIILSNTAIIIFLPLSLLLYCSNVLRYVFVVIAFFILMFMLIKKTNMKI